MEDTGLVDVRGKSESEYGEMWHEEQSGCRRDGHWKQRRNNKSQEHLAIAALRAIRFFSIQASHHHQLYRRNKASLGDYTITTFEESNARSRYHTIPDT